MRLTASMAIEGMSRRRHFWLLVFDSTVWILAVAFAALARMDFQFASVRMSCSLTFLPSKFRSTDSKTMRIHTGRREIGPTPAFCNDGKE